MNSAHWHLLLNHFPIIGTYFSTLLLILGIMLKSQPIKNIALGFFILTTLFAIPALLTGEDAEDVLSSIGQKNETFIHSHEKQAQNAFWFSISIAILSLGALLGRLNIKNNRILILIILIAGLVNSVLMTLVGNSGGQIRHTEIRAKNSE